MAESDVRMRKLTEKGNELFEEKNSIFIRKLKEAWALVEPVLKDVNYNDKEAIKARDHEICMRYGDVRIIARDYRYFLRSTRTERSEKLLNDFYEYDAKRDDSVHSVLKKITERLNNTDTVSQMSGQSGRSTNSQTSSAKARAKLGAAKARIELSKKELELKTKQALIQEEKTVRVAKADREEKVIQAQLDLLNEQKILAEAEVESEVYETISQCGSSNSIGIKEEESHAERTENYVQNQMRFVNLNDENENVNIEGEQSEMKLNSHAVENLSEKDVLLPRCETTPLLNQQSSEERAKPYVAEHSSTREFGQYLAKKDLLLTRFQKFNDDPVNYHLWRTTFKSICDELSVSPQEEIDLLTKWLGPESSKQTISLRLSNLHNPDGGLAKIWERLDERYGAPELVENCLRKRLEHFPKITPRDYKKLYELCDLLSEIESVKENPCYSALFASYDSPVGVNVILSKLPYQIQSKWSDKGRKYKVTYGVPYPPFHYFVAFMRDVCSLYNDPSFQVATTKDNPREATQPRPLISAKKGEVTVTSCPLHAYATHTLQECREFKKKHIDERRKFLKEKKLCFKCLSDKHTVKNCVSNVKCRDCNSTKHCTAMHIQNRQSSSAESGKSDGGEKISKEKNAEEKIPERQKQAVNCKLSQINAEPVMSKSCAKIVKAYVYHKDNPKIKIMLNAIIDDQSNKTLASPDFFDAFSDNHDFREVRYLLSTCGGSVNKIGRVGESFTIESLDGNCLDLPDVTECFKIPNNRDEIPSPDIALRYPHLRHIASNIPELDDRAQIMLLIGRDMQEAHHVEEQIISTSTGPFAQRLKLGWVLIGESCIQGKHTPTSIHVNKTFVHKDGRCSMFQACENKFYMTHEHNVPEDVGLDIFVRTRDDNKPGLSIEDRQFIDIMNSDCIKNKDGNWVAPLPFHLDRPTLPNNRDVALKRALYLDTNLRRNPVKAEHFTTFMAKVISSGAAEVAPPLGNGEVWYLPIFGIYHPKKPDKIRGVFDSSAICKGTSLNSTLLSGPNLINSLLAVLLRFRKDSCAVIADIEQMFYSFLVQESHRDYLRFFWYRNNDLNDSLIEYRMCAHVFGNSPSPAVASYCLRKTVEDAEEDVKAFVNNNFYVDDGLISLPDTNDTISLIKRTQACLNTAKLRLHKIASNKKQVMKAFPEEDLQSDLKSLNLDVDKLPVNQSLGLSWELNSDSFRFNLELESKPYTRRGLLSTLNSVYDPLGFAAPVTICGKMLLREITTGCDWDEPLNPDLETKWDAWKHSLLSLREVTIPRMYSPESLSMCVDKHLCIFSDASEKAVSAVVYIRTQSDSGEVLTGFVIGKSKLAPTHGHTIPRLELCAALLAAELGETVISALDVTFNSVRYYTDSRVVLGYINNTTRRFFNYVCNRVQRILFLTKADQWHYVNTKSNPADIGSRGCMSPEMLTTWLQCPDLLQISKIDTSETFSLILPDKEVRQEVSVLKSSISISTSDRFERFSCWRRLVTAFVVLKRAARNFKSRKSADKKKSACDKISTTADYRKEAELFIVRAIQSNTYYDEIECLQKSKPVDRNSPIVQLNPFLDKDGIVRVGGRLGLIDSSVLSKDLVKPVVLSSKDYISTLLVRYYHDLCNHQGRHITEGAIRNAGFWIVGAKRLISCILHKCVSCRKRRGKTEHQLMADLPTDRLTPGPPFSYVGVDVFGPWEVVARRTRGGVAHTKRWAALFTCLTTRAVHIEVLEEMSSSSFINALRRFIAVRGNVKEFRSDRGTNFVGAMDDLKFNVVNVEDEPVADYLAKSSVTWKFNPPHSSHMGGVWERMIGMARRVLDNVLSKAANRHLTHEVLVTLMAEVMAILNSRPIAPISSDPDNVAVLTPSILLNQKIDGDPSVCFDLDLPDMYKKQWKMVQVLSDLFWKQWKDNYLNTLQSRRKWQKQEVCIKDGDVVLLKDKTIARAEWPIGVVVNAIPSESDKLVRKAEVRVCKHDRCSTLTRPITDMILLVN